MNTIRFSRNGGECGNKVGIFDLQGKYIAVTYIESKTFKTLSGALSYMQKRGYNKM